MQESEDLECVVCCCRYSRSRRIPRLLHCRHTFCAPCLERLSRMEGAVRTISCPLCRWITCTSSTQGLPSVLWVNTEIWDLMVEVERRQQEKRRQGSVEEDLDLTTRTWATLSDPRQPGLKTILQRVFSCVPTCERELGGC